MNDRVEWTTGSDYYNTPERKHIGTIKGKVCVHGFNAYVVMFDVPDANGNEADWIYEHSINRKL